MIITNSAISSNWRTLGTFNESTYYINTDTLKKDKNILHYWVKITPTTEFKEVKFFSEINCMTNEHRTVYGQAISTEGMGYSKPMAKIWKPIAPDTFIQDIYKSYCEN